MSWSADRASAPLGQQGQPGRSVNLLRRRQNIVAGQVVIRGRTPTLPSACRPPATQSHQPSGASRLFVARGYLFPSAAGRSRLRRPPLRFSEFVQSACLYSIAHPPDGQDHSAYIPDHGNCPLPCRGWPASGPGRLRPGPCLLAGVFAEAPGSSVTSRARPPGTFRLCSLPRGHSPA